MLSMPYPSEKWPAGGGSRALATGAGSSWDGWLPVVLLSYPVVMTTFSCVLELERLVEI